MPNDHVLYRRLANYGPTQRKLERAIRYWEPLFDLPGVKVDHLFLDSHLDEQEDMRTGAITITRWEYRLATIHWYLPALSRMADDELEGYVVHEYCHVLNAPMDAHLKGGAMADVVRELVTESMSRALMKARDKRPPS